MQTNPRNALTASSPATIATAVCCGLTPLFTASLFEVGTSFWWFGPTPTIIPVVVASSLAGLIIGIATADRAPRLSPFSEASTKAGFMAAFVAAAVVVARTTVIYGKPGHLTVVALVTLFVAVVTILPGTLFAMFCGGFGRALRLAFDADPSTGRAGFSFRPQHIIYFLCALALLSPFLPGVLKEPPPPVVVVPPPPEPPPKPIVELLKEPEPPRFSYEKPEGLDSADASRITLKERLPLPDVDTSAVMAFSPDGRKLAFHRTGDALPALSIIELHTSLELSRITCATVASSLVWSPDNQRLATVFTSDGSRQFGVVFPDRQRVITLPRPESPTIPAGTLSWPDNNEVVLHPADGKPMALNLDSLEFRSLDAAPFFAALDDAHKQTVKDSVPAMPATPNWSLGIGWTLNFAGPRFAEGLFAFKTLGHPGIVATSIDRSVRRHLSDLALRMGSRILFSPDNAKAVVIDGNQASVFYLGLRDAPKTVRQLDMKKKLTDFVDAEVLKKALSERRLCAFIYSPFTNPLNNKVVGADYGSVKASVRFISWTDTSAEMWIQDEYAPVEPGDVVSVLYACDERDAKPFAENAGTWWTTIRDDGTPSSATVPLRKDTPITEIGPQIESSSSQRIFSFTVKSERPQRLPPTRPEPARSDTQPREQSAVSERAVVNFINFHHQKSSNGDINGLMSDYSDVVEHFNKGYVPVSRVRAEEEKYHAPGYKVFEKVRGQVRLDIVEHDRVSAKYELQFLRVNPDATWVKGVADVTLEILATPQGLRITKQNSTTRENEKEKGRGNLPSF